MEKEKNIFEIKEGVLIKLNNKYLSKVVIPEGITEIGTYAFYGCRKITSINIPKNVKIIEDNIFYNCDNLVNIIIPTGVTTIGNWAFNRRF